jgi:hypothetical protein
VRDAWQFVKRVNRASVALPGRLNAGVRWLWTRRRLAPIRAWIERRRWLIVPAQDILTPSLVILAAYPFLSALGVFSYFLVLPIFLWLTALTARSGLTDPRMRRVRRFLLVAFIVAPFLLQLYFLDFWLRIGDWSGYLFRIGLFCFLGAVFFRAAVVLIGRRADGGASVRRIRLAMAVSVCALAYGVNGWLGSLPGWKIIGAPGVAFGLGSWRALVVDALAVALVGAAFGLVLGMRPCLDDEFARVVRAGAPVGAGFALVAPMFIAFIPQLQWVEVSNVAHGSQYLGGAPTKRPDEFRLADEKEIEALARAYAPILVLDRQERWPAASVDEYLRDADLLEADAVKGRVLSSDLTVEKLPRSCLERRREARRYQRICFALTARCEHVEPSCDKSRENEWDELDVLREGTIYARVLVRGRPLKDGSPEVFRGPLPYRDLYALIQYWVFFRNDLWDADAAIGSLRQRHEGDWEAVIVGLSPTGPLFVAYTHHCGGTWVPWEKAERVAQAAGDEGLHPVAWVARGSHALYPDPKPREPNWTSCTSLAHRPVALLSFAGNVREAMPKSDYIFQVAAVGVADALDQPFSFPGRWATRDETLLRNPFREQRLLPWGDVDENVAHGPETPACKAIWLDPLAIMFCHPRWTSGRCPRGVDHERWHEVVPSRAATCV